MSIERFNRPRERRPGRQRAAARAAKVALRDAKAALVHRDEGRCVVCGEQATDPHHRRNRGMGGATRSLRAHALSRLVLLCRPCHDRVGAEPAWAERCGLWIRHDVRPEYAVPLLYRGVWVFLGDDGSVTAAGA